jgi:hypothetical protein
MYIINGSNTYLQGFARKSKTIMSIIEIINIIHNIEPDPVIEKIYLLFQ